MSEIIKLSTAVCGIDCFNCELYYTNIDSFFETMSEDRQTAIVSRGMTVEVGMRHFIYFVAIVIISVYHI
jgi:hypothetical protein